MTISDNNRKFLEDLLEYYINESSSYMQIAEEYSDITDSKTDTAFGIMLGIDSSCFLLHYMYDKPYNWHRTIFILFIRYVRNSNFQISVYLKL